MDRLPRICCLDLDTFFVSVERLLDPSLEGLPVVVGGHKGARGVVTAASYEVRVFGVRSGMPMAEAVRRAPHAVFLPTRHGVYGPYSEQVRDLLTTFTPRVQTASIDEYFLDFRGSESMYRRPDDRGPDATIERVVRTLRLAIQEQIGLPASAGVAVTRPVAKIASALAKPAGVRLVAAGAELDALGRLDVRRYPGIGPVTEARLEASGIHMIGQLMDLAPGPLRARFEPLSQRVRRGVLGPPPRGLAADRPAFREHDPVGAHVGSISNERTFMADYGDDGAVEQQLQSLCERVCWRARKRQIAAGTVTLKLRYSDFTTFTRSRSIPPTDEDGIVWRTVSDLLDQAWDRRRRVRLVGVALSNLAGHGGQLMLPFDKVRVGPALDRVRERFGYDAIHLGSAVDRGGWIA